MPTIEELLRAWYGGDHDALNVLAARLDPYLTQIATATLLARGIPPATLVDWDIEDRLSHMWAAVVMSRVGRRARWPHERWSALRWLVSVLCEEMDRALGLTPPF